MVDGQEGDFSTTPTQESLPLEPNESGPQNVGQDVRFSHSLKVDIHLAPMLNGARWCIEAAFGESKIDLLVDTGASVSVLHSRVYNQMKSPPKLVPTNFRVFGVSGAKVKFLGQAQICFMLGDKE